VVCFRIKFDGTKWKGEYVFSQPGRYFVKGGYKDTTGVEAYSEPIKITVVDPVGEDATVWLKLRGSEAYGRLIQLPASTHLQGDLDKLGEIARKHPKSIYSTYIIEAFENRRPSFNSATIPPKASDDMLSYWLTPVSIISFLLALMLEAILTVLIWRRRVNVPTLVEIGVGLMGFF
jgi:hypothetical protein